MAYWCEISPQSIPAIALQAAFSLLVLLAATAPSLHSATVGTWLQGAESASIGENAAAGDSIRTAESSRPEISPRPATPPRPKPQTPTSVFVASPKPSEPTKPTNASAAAGLEAEKSVNGGSPGGGGGGENKQDKEDEQKVKKESESPPKGNPERTIRPALVPGNDPKSTTTSTSTSKAEDDATKSMWYGGASRRLKWTPPNGGTPRLAASFATFTVAFCASVITSSCIHVIAPTAVGCSLVLGRHFVFS